MIRDDDGELPASAAAREHARDRVGNDRPEEYPHAGLVGDDETRALLSALADHYDPVAAAEHAGVAPEQMPATIDETDLYRSILGRESTETLSRAIHRGDEQTQSYFVGDPGSKKDISGLSAISELQTVMFRAAPIVYIFGPPGSGKTNFALLLSQLWKREHPNGEIGSNIRTWEEADRWIPRYPALDSWLGENTREIEGGGITQRDDADPLLFVFDEASSHASGRGSDGYQAGQLLGPLIYKIRKSNAGIIIIGHDGKDVHPAVRTLATVVQRRRGELKTATLWEDVKDRQGRGRIMDLAGIPETDYRYDDGEATSWSWDGEEEDEGPDMDRVRELAQDLTEDRTRRLAAFLADSDWIDMTQVEIGRAIGEAVRGEPYSQKWVSKWKSEFTQDEPAAEETSDLPALREEDRDDE